MVKVVGHPGKHLHYEKLIGRDWVACCSSKSDISSVRRITERTKHCNRRCIVHRLDRTRHGRGYNNAEFNHSATTDGVTSCGQMRLFASCAMHDFMCRRAEFWFKMRAGRKPEAALVSWVEPCQNNAPCPGVRQHDVPNGFHFYASGLLSSQH